MCVYTRSGPSCTSSKAVDKDLVSSTAGVRGRCDQSHLEVGAQNLLGWEKSVRSPVSTAASLLACEAQGAASTSLKSLPHPPVPTGSLLHEWRLKEGILRGVGVSTSFSQPQGTKRATVSQCGCRELPGPTRLKPAHRGPSEGCGLGLLLQHSQPCVCPDLNKLSNSFCLLLFLLKPPPESRVGITL